MKARNYFVLPLIVAGAVTVSSCGKKEEKKTDGAAAEAVSVVKEVLEEAKPTGNIDELAANAGFAQYLSKDTAMMFHVYGVAKHLESFRLSKVGRFINSLDREKGGKNIDKAFEDPGFKQFLTVAGEEMFIALGEGGDQAMANLLQVSSDSNYYQMRMMVKVLSKGLSGDQSGLQDLNEMAYVLDLFKDAKTVEMAENFEATPLFVGFKVSDAEQRKMLVEKIQQSAEQLLAAQDAEKPVLVASSKDAFKGFTVKGDLVAKQLDSESEVKRMKEKLGEETFTRYRDALGKKEVSVLAGEYKDYVVLFMGASVDQLKFAGSPADSVLGHKDMQFATQYGSKELVSLGYVDEKSSKAAVGNQAAFKHMARGILDGLKENDAFGDTRVVEALLGDLIKREDALYANYKGGRSGAVAFIEDGLKVESYYAGNAPSVDLKSKRQLSGMAKADGVLFSANWISDAEQTQLGLEYVDAIGNTAYQVAKQVSGLKIEKKEFKEFAGGFGMIDGMFKADLLEIWGALRTDLVDGLGTETAIVVDVKGELPTVPMVPEGLVKEAKLPRLSYISTVDDRSKVGVSWNRLNTTAESLLKRVGQMSGTPIPMQRPFKSESNGLTSWTFQIPFTHQNCTPSVTISDDLFIVGTSPNFATELAGLYEKEGTGAPMAEMKLNFDVLRDLGGNWLTSIEKHMLPTMPEAKQKEFNEAKPILEGLLKASEGLESLSSQSCEEAGEIRNSIHFKTR